MSRDKIILKELLQHLPKNELVDMVLKLSAKRFNYEFLLVNFLDPEYGEQILFEEALEDIELLCAKDYKGRTPQHRQVKMLIACIKRATDFTVEVKNKKLEADLIVNILERQFVTTRIFGARYSGYDYKVALLLKKLISLITKKLHPDYFIDYQDKVNFMLSQIHQTSDRVKTIKELPAKL